MSEILPVFRTEIQFFHTYNEVPIVTPRVRDLA